MGQGFRAMPTGLPAIVAKFKDIDRAIDAVRRQAISPVSAAVANAQGSGLDPSDTFVTLAETHTPTPDGYSRALVSAVGSAGCSCGPTGGTAIEVNVIIANVPGLTRVAFVQPNTGSGSGAHFGRLITGLQGGDDIGVGVLAFQTAPGNVLANTVGGDLTTSIVFLR